MSNVLGTLGKSLEEKAKILAEAIDRADPTTSKYHDLLMNFDITMSILNNINMSLNRVQPIIDMAQGEPMDPNTIQKEEE